MATNAVAVVPVFDGAYKNASLEAVSEAARAAKALGGEAIALVVGKGAEGAAAGLGGAGATKVTALAADSLENYNGDVWGSAVAQAISTLSAGVVFVTASALGKDLGPRIAARLETGYASDVTGMTYDGANPIARRPVYAGKSYVNVTFQKAPAVASLRPNNFTVSEGGADVAADALSVDIPAARVELVEVKKQEGKVKPDLTEASRIVSGGRGLKGAEAFGILESLADLLGATVGASRAVVDAGWRPHSDQVGQTGKTVSPNLYVAAGISGAIQHLAGMRTSKCIVAINKDKEAPICKVADYGIVGDLFEVVPALEAELKKVLA
ncbi:MAG: electron transfer flavoprotein subunit alpha/FixB family protein [Planctomycetota bacterium]|jgi:electron transfer flavoprotein alpha subunit